MNNLIKKICRTVFWVCLSINVGIYAADLIQGDQEAQENQSFSFPVRAHSSSSSGIDFYTGALNAGGKNFAIARLLRGSTDFIPLTPQRVSLNDKDDQDNPLFNAPISFLSLLESQGLVAVTPDRKNNIYLVDTDKLTNPSLRAIQNITDASGKEVANGIVGLAAGNKIFIFAGVRGKGQDQFGKGNSGIVPLVAGTIIEVKEEEEQIKQEVIAQFDAPAPLNTSSAVVKIQNDLTQIGDIVDLHWDVVLNRLYIALRVEAGNNPGDGARALVVGRMRNNKLELKEIAPSTILGADQNEIVGTIGANAQVSLHKVRTLWTSTRLNYVILLGGNGDPSATQRTIFALPVVSNVRNTELNGTLAKKDADPVATFSGKKPSNFLRRGFVTPATNNEDIFTTTDNSDNIPARIGGGPVPFGDVVDMFVQGDAVFVAVGNAVQGQKPGLFHSQALFDATGRIKGWTAWQRVAGTTDQIFGAALDPAQGNFILMSRSDDQNIMTIKRTVWGHGDEEGLQLLTNLLGSEFQQENAGIHGLVNFSQETPGLNNISLLIATGLRKIMLIESGQVNAETGMFCPNGGDFATNKQSFQNGTITNNNNASRTIAIAGGALNDIASIDTAEIAQSGSNGWLFIGGAGGLAILSQEDGQGWDTNTGALGPAFTGLTEGMSFKIIGDYSLVRKIIFDESDAGSFLYILTDKQLDRIDLEQKNVGIGNIEVVTLATVSDVPLDSNTAFLDCIVSEKFALLATNNGLLRVGNDRDIRTATQIADVGWTSVILPEGQRAVIQLFVISATGRQQDVARGAGGVLYVLNAFSGTNRAQINRFSIMNIVDRALDDSIIQPLPDFFIEDIPSYFVNFGLFRNAFTTDGSLFFHAHDRDANEDPLLMLLPPGVRTGDRFTALRSSSIPLDLKGTSHIKPIIRNTASGSWLVAGDFGLRVNE